MELLLTRDTFGSTYTYGVMTVGLYQFQTIELPWLDNEHDVSCVPVGTYTLVPHDTPKHPKTFALVNFALNVIHEPDSAYPNARTACLIHAANWAYQLEGCIGVGLTRGTLDAQAAILNSQAALQQIQSLVPWTDGHSLTIQGVSS